MIAPSPDWFVGVHALPLRDGSGWVNDLSIDLFAWDAGTERGNGFRLGNPNQNPAQPIALRTSPFLGTPLATLHFELVPEPSAAIGSGASLASLFLLRRRRSRL